MSQANPFISTQITSQELIDSSKQLAAEIRKDDAAMATHLAVLAPHSSRYYRLRQLENERAGADAFAKDAGAEDKVATVEVYEKVTMDEFIAKKREVGLVHKSLATKRAEIRKLDEEIDCAEKKLHQQQEQLENTREKFNNFLKHSNLEQDAAVRRADMETKAKQSKKIEIKKLSARINHIELEIRKGEVQVETCKLYKKFLDDLAKPRWFYDVLIELRIAEKVEGVLQATEAEYEKKSASVKKMYDNEVKMREESARLVENANKFRKASALGELESPVDEDELVPLEAQLEKLHHSLEEKAQVKVEEISEQIREEVNALTLDEVRSALERDYEENQKPTYYTDVDQLLDVFINVEEGNLFLIQNCQELEEELERVANEHHAEKSETLAMTKQRHMQMQALAEKIRGAQVKLRQLEQRASDLEKHVPSTGKDDKNDKKGVPEELSPEQFKVEVEKIITKLFRTLSSGDAVIKSLTTQQQLQEREQLNQGEDNLGGGDEGMSGGSKKSPRGPSKASPRAEGPKRTAKKKEKANGGAAKSTQQTEGSSETAGSNMGPVEMLTIIENKLEEYHRYISDPQNAVEEPLIQQVMKASDKERRRQARLIHMEKQAREQEAKSRRALERSRAPVLRRTGKPVLPRSRWVTIVEKGKEGKAPVGSTETETDLNEFL